MRRLVHAIIRKKNPHFKLHPSVSTMAVVELVFQKGMAWLRSFKLLLRGKFPRLLFLGPGVQFFNASNIQLGKWVQLEERVTVSALSVEPVRIGRNVRIGAFSKIIASTSFNNPGVGITIGNDVGIGEFAYLGGGGGLEIGAETIVGQYFSCHPENHNYADLDRAIRLQGVSRKGIKIGRNCWIGSKVTILDGVTIGENCIIAAGAVVTKSMPGNSIIGGVPAKVLKRRVREKQSVGEQEFETLRN